MKLIDADALKRAILSTMPERSEVLLIVDNQPEIKQAKQDGKSCANCSMSKIRVARGTGCYYRRCKKHDMWVRHGFYCADWKGGDGDEG